MQNNINHVRRKRLARGPLTVAIWVAMQSTAFAQDTNTEESTEPQRETRQLDEISVTAQKRTENVQEVPINIQVMGVEALSELNVSDFEDFATMLPSVSIDSGGPGFTRVYMRGVASGENGNHSGPQPSVGMYLDEQPITTITGALDVHVYDVERVESLAGPQGTLYGASSQAGTIRIITNKPDASAFAAGYGLETNVLSGGGVGYVGEGYVNLPFNDNAAIRFVGWQKRDAGFIDNVIGSRTFPSSNITVTNTDTAEDDYNDVQTTGARVALKFDFNENWSITPAVIAQRQHVDGIFAYDPGIGDRELSHAKPERADDEWRQIALTLQGKIGNFDLTYAFADLKRDVDSESDYADYAFWYDTLFGYGTYFTDDNGDLVDPTQYIQATDGYKKRSHELRLASPSDQPLRFVAGIFWQEQRHDILQRYRIDNLATSLSVPGWEDTIWLTRQIRRDRDEALFGELTYDFTEKFSGTVGARSFRANNSLKGFFGFGSGYSSGTGEAACFDQTDFLGAPCINLDKQTKEDDWLGRVNLTYKINPDKMVYFTWSEGYRPGGINRRGTLPPYTSDFLTNFEAGWKTSWNDNTLQWNGAVFQENWDDFQFSLLGLNGLTEIKNANQARIRGLETDFTWAATYNLRLGGGMALYDAKLTENYCGETDDNGVPITVCDEPQAPAGTRLPISARFKGNLNARYSWDSDYEPYFQAVVVHEGERESDLRLEQREILGKLDAYTTLDVSAGMKFKDWNIDLFIKNVTDTNAETSRFAQCAETVCGAQTYISIAQPRTFGVRFSQEF